MLKMSFMSLCVCLDTSQYGVLHLFKLARVLANRRASMHKAVVKWLLPINSSRGFKWASVEAIKWVLYLFTDYDTCY
jgi:hypothetical protein